MDIIQVLTKITATQRDIYIGLNVRFSKGLIYYAVYFEIVFAIGIINSDHFAYRVVIAK